MHNEVENQAVKVAHKNHADDTGDDACDLNFVVARDAAGHIVADPAVVFEH